MPLLLQSPSFDVWWESQRGTFRLESPGRVLEGVAGVEVVRRGRLFTLTTADLDAGRMEDGRREDSQGVAETIGVRYQAVRGLALSVFIRLYLSRPFLLFRVAVNNVGSETVHVRRFFFNTLPEGFQSLEPPNGFFAHGWQSWSPSGFLPARQRGFNPGFLLRWLEGPMVQNAHTPWGGSPGRFWSESVGAVVTPREALVAGGASLADQFVQLYADLRSTHPSLMLQSQADDVPLDPGEAQSSEWFYLEWVAMPHKDPLAQYAHAVARQMALPAPRPAPTGWCSWYIYGDQVAEADVMKNLATAALLADEIPLEVLQLDEGFQRVWGEWTQRNDRFPHDLKWLADRIRGSGFTPGLWLAPLVVHPKSALAQAHPDWLLRNRRGRPVSAGLIATRFFGRALDPTHPGVEEYVRTLIREVVHEWGYRYLKLDFMYAGALPGQRHQPRMTRAQALRHAFRLIRETVGEEVYILGCGAPFGPALGLVDAMRIGPDTAPRWWPQVFGLRRFFAVNPTFPSLRNSLRNVLARAWIHGRWWVNDPDTLMVRDTQTQLTDDEVRSQVTLLGLAGNFYFLSDDLGRLSAERRALVSMLFPPLLDGMDVLDLFRQEMPEAVVVPVARPWGRWQLVGLFNWRDEPVERELYRAVALDRRKAYHLMDFWAQRYLYLEPDAPSPVFHLPPHGCALVGVRVARRGVQLVGTTFHISQGGEITAWEREGSHVLAVTLEIGRLARGAVWLVLPSRPQAATLDGEPLDGKAIRALAPGVWAVTFSLYRQGTLRLTWLT